MNITYAELARMLEANDQVAVYDFTPPRRATKTEATLKQDAPWTQTERLFALEVLQPALERGKYLWYMAQVTVYMLGQTYTFDFVALRPDGGADHYEVKGSAKLMSEERASVKVRWATSLVGTDPHRVFWAKKGDDEWKIRQIQLKRSRHPVVR